MYILNRKRNESIVIAGGIVITVLDVRKDKVRLGIEAPKELYQESGENRDADDSSESPPT